MIELRDITLRRGGEPLLEGASATIHAGRHVGLLGANGSGKSTLLAALRGEIAPDAGELKLPEDWTLAWMAQETPALDRPAIEHVLDGDAELRAAEAAVADAEAGGDGEAIGAAHARYENAGGYTARARAGELLDGLGFAPADHDRPVAELSGGWRVRLNLARALFRPADLLLLDEPTNHLDLEAVLFLEQRLRAYDGTLVVIAHDREFLDAVCDEVLHIEHRRLNAYRGGYSDFEHQRAERLARQQALYEKQQRELAHMQRFVDRFRAKASKARAAQSRLRAMERMARIAPAHVDTQFSFAFPDAPAASNPMVSFDEVSLGYGDTVVLSGISGGIRPGERIGLLGPNGAGKSTLVRALAGELAPLAGEITAARNLRVGYFAQHQVDQLDAAATPVEHLQRVSPQAREQRLRDFLGGFAFHGDMATSPVEPLSGGEKARLALALLVWQAPNLLLLDEPTNHFDLEMRHALTIALQGFSGAVVTVAHDRHLLASTVDEYWLVADGCVRDFDGDLDNYREWLTERRRENRRSAQPAVEKSGGNDRRAARRRAAERRTALRPLRDRVNRLVAEIESLDAELSEIETELAAPALYEDSGKSRLTELLRRQGELRGRRETLEEEWIAAEGELEAARASAGAG